MFCGKNCFFSWKPVDPKRPREEGGVREAGGAVTGGRRRSGSRRRGYAELTGERRRSGSRRRGFGRTSWRRSGSGAGTGGGGGGAHALRRKRPATDLGGGQSCGLVDAWLTIGVRQFGNEKRVRLYLNQIVLELQDII